MKVVITGGAGFIGSNAARRHLERGDAVVIIDNLSRAGGEANLAWLRELGRPFVFLHEDVRGAVPMERIFRDHADASLVLHLAGQVAVTTSVQDPRSDFDVNASGTLNVLEGMRRAQSQATLIYASTNKVYGGLAGVRSIVRNGRHEFASVDGISEDQPLDFHSPYGCSKGAADQYVRDYARIYGLRTIVLRQSCIYGYRQFGVEDQGWLGWFCIAAHQGRPIRIYGDGRQVRDVLFIEDLLDAFDAASVRAPSGGAVYNIGGGPANAVSLLQVIGWLEQLCGHSLPLTFRPWRPGDQKIYISGIARAERELDWRPSVSWQAGLQRLYEWVASHVAMLV
jgi:CDP-paratose 2-epimerase